MGCVGFAEETSGMVHGTPGFVIWFLACGTTVDGLVARDRCQNIGKVKVSHSGSFACFL